MYEDANLTVTGIKANFADNEKYYEALEEIAEQYDRAGQFPRAVVIYRQIVENCRGDEICALAQANLDKYELFAAVDTGDNELIEQTVSGLGKSFTNQPDRLDDYLNTLAKKCYSEAQWSVIEDNKERAAPYYRAALRMRERVFNECPNSPLAPVACFCAAVIAQQELGDYAQGIEYFQKTADDWPGYEHSPWALVKVASTLELAGRDGLLDADGARLAAIAVLKSVIDKYPQDEMAKYAQERLDYYNKDESEQDPEQPATCGSNKEGEL
jgi:tetratricopeptide (TPR) repeat protein